MNKTHSGNAGAVWKRCTYRLFQHLNTGRKNRLKNSDNTSFINILRCVSKEKISWEKLENYNPIFRLKAVLLIVCPLVGEQIKVLNICQLQTDRK
ncbi:MAG: hypothetical protein C6W58_16775 [Bacillaceae bacterium]|nr:MAG: hypothetical protein C6W58_16775 [Bacillaceae bacterium]